jgi:hypothetical protein
VLDRFTRNQKILGGAGIAVVVLLVLGLVVFGGGGDEEDAAPTTTSTTEATTTTTAPPVAPLTGQPLADEAMRNRPALMVKVDNVPKAFPLQEGVESADVVYVEEVENGATRLAVVFQSKDDTVGPVRSARTSDLEIAAPFNMPYFAYSGANAGVLSQVRGGPMIDMGVDRAEASPVYSRNQRGRGLNRFFIPTKEMYEAGRDGAKTPPPFFTWRGEGDVSTGEAAAGVQIAYAGGAATTVRYDWDAAAGGWKRSQNGRGHVMADSKAHITPPNVIVQFTEYHASPYADVTGARSPEATMVGEGEAWVFTDGKLVRGRWTRPTANAVTSFVDAGGQPIALTPGQTFVELVPAPGSFLGAGTATVI